MLGPSGLGKIIATTHAKDQSHSIPYRPQYSRITGKVAASILLQQISYWWHIKKGKPFYKFRAPCAHDWYKEGDSWTEELGMTPGGFDTALKAIGAKVTKGESKSELLKTNLVIYWTDASRVTWYQLNESLFYEAVYLAYNKPELLGKSGFRNQLSKSGSGNFLYTETTPETTQRHVANATPTPDDAQPQWPTCKKCGNAPIGDGGGGLCDSCYCDWVRATRVNAGVVLDEPAEGDATDEPCTCGNDGLCGNCGKPADEPPSLVPVKPFFDGGPDGYLPPMACGDATDEPPARPVYRCKHCGDMAKVDTGDDPDTQGQYFCIRCGVDYFINELPIGREDVAMMAYLAWYDELERLGYCQHCLKHKTTTAEMRDVHSVCTCKQEATLVDEFGPRQPRKPQKPVEHWTVQAAQAWAQWGETSDEFQKQLQRFGDSGRIVQELGYKLQIETGLKPLWGTPKKVKWWSSGLWELYEEAGHSIPVAIEAVRKLKASKASNGDKMTVSSPYSFVNTARALAAEKVAPPVAHKGMGAGIAYA